MTPDKLPLPPSWLVEAAGQQTRTRVAGPVAPGEIPEGGRNDTLFRMASSMRRYNMSEAGILAALQAENQERCQPPLDDVEVRTIARQGAKYEPNQTSQAVVEGWADQDATDDDPAEITAADPGELPAAFCEVPGLLGDVIRWNLATALKPQPPMALAAAIALMGAVTGRKITDRLDSRTNVYTICLANSGVGKEHARKVNKTILQLSNMEDRIGPESIASGAGLVVAVGLQSEILIQIDEIGRFLQTVGNPAQSPHLFQIITVFLKLFTSSNSLYVGDAYADAKKIKKIEQPHCCLYGTSVPKSFFDALTEESLTDGFVGRLLVFEAGKQPEMEDDREPADFVPPSSIIETATWWRNYNPCALARANSPIPRKLADSADAKIIFRELSAVAKGFPDGSIKSAIWIRAHEKARKLALMYSVSENPEALEISTDAAVWGCGVVSHLTKRLEYLADRHVADGAFGKASLRVLRLIEDSGKAGLSRNILCQRTRGLRPRERAEIIESLNQQGKVSCNSINTSGRPKSIYVAIRFLA